MSVDVSCHFGKPVSLASVAGYVPAVLSDLLGGPRVVLPPVRVNEGWAAPEGAAPLVQSELSDRIIGGHGSAGSVFTFRIAGTPDPVILSVMDRADEDDPDPEMVGYASPCRTCTGVVLALAIVLSIGLVSGGALGDDWQLPRHDFVEEPAGDPQRFLDLTRMPLSAGLTDINLPARCEEFLRRFPRLGGWPRDRSIGVTASP